MANTKTASFRFSEADRALMDAVGKRLGIKGMAPIIRAALKRTLEEIDGKPKSVPVPKYVTQRIVRVERPPKRKVKGGQPKLPQTQFLQDLRVEILERCEPLRVGVDTWDRSLERLDSDLELAFKDYWTTIKKSGGGKLPSNAAVSKAMNRLGLETPKKRSDFDLALIRKWHREFSARFHPDKHGGDERYVSQYRDVQAAWAVLKEYLGV